MPIRKIRQNRERLADQIRQQLLDAIGSGDIGADERLVQEKLAEALEVSRTPVREALLALEREGILVTSPRGGFLIRHLSDDEVVQLYDARGAVEGQAARWLALHGDAASVRALRESIARRERAGARSVRGYFEVNRDIHREIVALTGNQYLLEMFDTIWNRAQAYSAFAAMARVDLSRSLGEHERLLDAIEAGEPGAAAEVAIAHVNDGLELQLEALRS